MLFRQNVRYIGARLKYWQHKQGITHQQNGRAQTRAAIQFRDITHGSCSSEFMALHLCNKVASSCRCYNQVHRAFQQAMPRDCTALVLPMHDHLSSRFGPLTCQLMQAICKGALFLRSVVTFGDWLSRGCLWRLLVTSLEQPAQNILVDIHVELHDAESSQWWFWLDKSHSWGADSQDTAECFWTYQVHSRSLPTGKLTRWLLLGHWKVEYGSNSLTSQSRHLACHMCIHVEGCMRYAHLFWTSKRKHSPIRCLAAREHVSWVSAPSCWNTTTTRSVESVADVTSPGQSRKLVPWRRNYMIAAYDCRHMTSGGLIAREIKLCRDWSSWGRMT